MDYADLDDDDNEESDDDDDRWLGGVSKLMADMKDEVNWRKKQENKQWDESNWLKDQNWVQCLHATVDSRPTWPADK